LPCAPQVTTLWSLQVVAPGRQSKTQAPPEQSEPASQRATAQPEPSARQALTNVPRSAVGSPGFPHVRAAGPHTSSLQAAVRATGSATQVWPTAHCR